MAYSRMRLEIKTAEGNSYPTSLENKQVSHNASVENTSAPECVHQPLRWDIWTSVRWKLLQFLSLCLWTCSLLASVCVLSVLLLPAYCFTNRTGPILHSTPSWPCGGVSVIATLLLFSLRAVVSQTDASLEVQQWVFHLKWYNRKKTRALVFMTDKLSQLTNFPPYISS